MKKRENIKLKKKFNQVIEKIKMQEEIGYYKKNKNKRYLK